MPNLISGDLRIEERPSTQRSTQLFFLGKSTARNPGEALTPFFDEVLGACVRDAAPLELHFETLEHFNSSTISVLIQVIQHAREQRVALTLVYSSGLKWQRLSFEALRVFSKGDDLFAISSV